MKLAPGQSLGVSIILRWNEQPDRFNMWTAHIISGQGKTNTIGLGMTPGEALNYGLLYADLIDTSFQPTEASGDV